MADFKQAVKLTLANEGGYVNDPLDPGGATNMGVTQRDMPGIDIRNITEDQAASYFYLNYWKALYSQINDQGIANKLFDMGVLFGVGTAVKILQAALEITADGSFGPVSLAAVNQENPDSLLQAYKLGLVFHAQDIVKAKPTSQKFLRGWTNRVNS